MKKLVQVISVLLLGSAYCKAQTTSDTVSTGGGYMNQVWYSLENNEQGSAPKNNWDIAFDTGGQGSSVLINSATGTTLWIYPNGDTAAWSSLDTTGITSWTKRWNSDTSWSLGAFSRYKTTNPYDVGWGIYSNVTHVVTGDSLFVIKLSNGTYKKVWMQQLSAGTYYFMYADLNGANLQTTSLAKATYSGKNFAYYSLQTNTALDREPVSSSWDLLFTQYTGFVPSPYTVAGVLVNKGVKVADVRGVDAPVYSNWSAHTYLTPINEIGYDWKAYTTSWIIEDSLVYFVKTNSGNVWKLVFTGFGGSSNGNYIFTKEKLSAVGIDENAAAISSVTLFPNPSNGETVSLVYNSDKTVAATYFIYELSGKLMSTQQIESGEGLNVQSVNVSAMQPGVYIIAIEISGQRIQKKLIVR